MAFGNFAEGLLQGFNNTGGVQRLSSWAARNIGDGRYYQPYTDPVFMQDYQQAGQIGTPNAQHDFIRRYDDHLKYQQPAEGPINMNTAQKAAQLFGAPDPGPAMIDPYEAATSFDPQGDWDFLQGAGKMPLTEFKDVFGQGIGMINPEREFTGAQTQKELSNAGLYDSQAGYYDQYGNLRKAEADYQNAIIDPTVENIDQEAFANEGLGNYRNAQAEYELAMIDPTVEKIDAETLAAKTLAGERESKSDLLKSQTETEEALRDPRVDLEQERVNTEQMNQYNLEGQGYRNFQQGNLYGAQEDRVNQLLPYEIDTEEQRAAELAAKVLYNQNRAADVGSSSIDPDGETGASETDSRILNWLYGGNPGTVDETGITRMFGEEGTYTPPIDQEGFIIDTETGQRWVNPVTGQPENVSDIDIDTSAPEDEGPGFLGTVFPYDNTGWFSGEQRPVSTSQNIPLESQGDTSDPVDRITSEFTQQFGREPQSHRELSDVIEQIPEERIQETYGMSKDDLIQLINKSYIRRVINESPNL